MTETIEYGVAQINPDGAIATWQPGATLFAPVPEVGTPVVFPSTNRHEAVSAIQARQIGPTRDSDIRFAVVERTVGAWTPVEA